VKGRGLHDESVVRARSLGAHMIRKFTVLLVGMLCVVASPAFAKKYKITFDSSCESATFWPDLRYGKDGNIWLYQGKGTGLCADFFGLGSKVKAKYFGIDSTWLLFSAQSTASGLQGFQYMIAVQYPITTGNILLEGFVSSDFQNDFLTSDTYTVTSKP
jgi:hypothetical protein